MFDFELSPLVEMLVYVVVLGLCLGGIIGALFPILPGTFLVFCAGLVYFFAFGKDGGLSVWVLVVLLSCVAADWALDYVASAIGAKKFGASGIGMFGAFCGSIAGMFFLPFGLILGPAIGALLFELSFRRDLRKAGGASLGAIVGVIFAIVCKLILVGAQLALMFLDIFKWK